MPDQKLCPNCKNEVSGRYCSHCGTKCVPETLDDWTARLVALETRFKDQEVVAVETAEMIASRLFKWTKMFAGSAATLITLVFIFFTVITYGRISDLRQLAASAHRNIEPIIDTARQEATNAKISADTALRSSREVTELVADNQASERDIQSHIEHQTAAINQNQKDISAAQAQISSLQRSVAEESDTIQQLHQAFEKVSSDKLVDTIDSRYPAFGHHEVWSRTKGYIDLSKKKAGDVYVGIDLWIADSFIKPPFSEQQFATVVSTLQDQRNFSVFLWGFDLQAVTQNGGVANIETMAGGSCGLFADMSAPCLLYFRPALKDQALKLKPIIAGAQSISDNQIRYIAPDTLTPSRKELVTKSGVDIMIVLSQ
jgi:hypothetical protein